jgi:hypothetical protein
MRGSWMSGFSMCWRGDRRGEGREVEFPYIHSVMSTFSIANQCPMLGGNAVFHARAMYGLIDDAQEFDDAELCLPHGIIVKSLIEVQENAVMVIPNPAMDEITLVLTKELDEPGNFILYNAVGKEVMRAIVPAGSARIPFNTSTLAPAMYHYTVISETGKIGDGKLSIVR